jgi:hypothetical protein
MSRATLLRGAVVLVAALSGCGPNAHPRGAAATVPSVPPARHASTPPPPTSRPHPSRPAAHTGALDRADDDEPHASHTQVSSAGSVARAFFTTFLVYLYGQLPARNVTGIDQGLRRKLAHGHAITTPAEHASPPHVIRLSLISSGPPISVTAVALGTTAESQPSQLTATLEPHHGTWVVVAASG